MLTTTADGGALTSGDDLSDSNLDRLDVRLHIWFGTTVRKCLDDVASLGEASGRRLFATPRLGDGTNKAAT